MKLVLIVLLLSSTYCIENHQLSEEDQVLLDGYSQNSSKFAAVLMSYVNFTNIISFESANIVRVRALEFWEMHDGLDFVRKIEIIVHEILLFGYDLVDEIELGLLHHISQFQEDKIKIIQDFRVAFDSVADDEYTL